jgi:bifunctional N-acetylglucosamine-1-phosphate-uridyltransferase/glucosamine-1-phosphate-acetyltransferase GlmU-like protein
MTEMRSWAAVVVANPADEGGGMVSRLPTLLHPVAGRPLIWHTVNSLLQAHQRPEQVLVLSGAEISTELFGDLSIEVQVASLDLPASELGERLRTLPEAIILIQAQAPLESGALIDLLDAAPGSWLGPAPGAVAAARVDRSSASEILRDASPFSVHHGWAAPHARIQGRTETFSVRNREDLARTHRRIRDQLVRTLMESGVTFMIPDSVVVDVDVRIGRDTVIYPGSVLEGQTTIGEETVVGPGCRIIDSWIGSGVELKGWNYISHTSVRNRAILEPYVRRGFD